MVSACRGNRLPVQKFEPLSSSPIDSMGESRDSLDPANSESEGLCAGGVYLSFSSLVWSLRQDCVVLCWKSDG
jgi:hypothetical protein